MKPFSHFFILALAVLAILAAPSISAVAPVDSASEFSTYRNWGQFAYESSYIDQYEYIENITSLAIVSVNGILIKDSINGPFPVGYGWQDLGLATTAEYDICWLDQNFTKQSIHKTEGWGQATANGKIFDTLYRAGLFLDVPEYARYSCWIEDAHISMNVGNNLDYQKVATWHINAAFSEQICIIAEYSLNGPSYQLVDPWNHPSVTIGRWGNYDWNGLIRAPNPAPYDKSLANDWPRNDLILAMYSNDNISSRSALYGYALAMQERMLSVAAWQQIVDADETAVSLLKGIDYINAAIIGTNQIMEGIRTLAIADIGKKITQAINNYHLAILYTDKAVIENSELYTPVGQPGDPDYMTLDEFRALFISIYCQPYIDELERDAPSSFAAWLFATPNALIMAGAAVSLAAVAVFWRSGAAGIAAVLMVILNVIMWKGDLL